MVLKIGVLKEIKKGEYRVILTPIEVEELTNGGHEVFVETMAGAMAGFKDEEYKKAGARVLHSNKLVYEESELIVKVKEFFEDEYEYIKDEHILFTCIHPAANSEEVDMLLDKECIAFTAEDTHKYGSPNCEVAGKLGALMGTYHLLSTGGGPGKLVCGIGGSPGINALVLGAGIVGKGATEILTSLGAQVTLMDINVKVLRDASYSFPKNLKTLISNQANIKKILHDMDLVINCVKWPKHRKDHLITRDMLSLMNMGSVIVDISADVGGAIETYKPTSHESPTYEVDGIIHYGVDNIPGAAPHSTSMAYAASIFHHIKSIADKGVKGACEDNGYLRRSLTVYKGILTHEETSVIQGREWVTPEEILDLNYEEIDIAPKATTTSGKVNFAK